VDPSALIFVALAVAWAVYLIPKALEHHDESARTRTVERFSHTMRVLARREPVSRKKARLIKAGDPTPVVVKNADQSSTLKRDPRTADPVRVRRVAAARAAKRRLRVVTLLLLANATVAVLAGLQVVAWVWTLVPVGVLVAWLVACRLMVKRERAVAPVRRTAAPAPAETPAATVAADETAETPVVTAETVDPVTKDPESWDPVPVTLPTYVSKPVAPRTVRTIDLDSTGVWSSGHNESDSALAREAEAADRAAKESSAEAERRRSS
jgi:hypothetical protein